MTGEQAKLGTAEVSHRPDAVPKNTLITWNPHRSHFGSSSAYRNSAQGRLACPAVPQALGCVLLLLSAAEVLCSPNSS